MTVKQFIVKWKLGDDFDMNRVPVRHPETGKKIYIISTWSNGFRYQKVPGRGDGQAWSCQYEGDLTKLIVHPDAKKEVLRRR